VAARARELRAQARAGRLTAADMRDATFTVTNLGMFGIDAFTPILLLPQSAVLGVGRIAPEPAVVADRVVPRETVALSLTFDHRVVDGAPAARFLDTLRRCLEPPAPWLLPWGKGPHEPAPRRRPPAGPPRRPHSAGPRAEQGHVAAHPVPGVAVRLQH